MPTPSEPTPAPDAEPARRRWRSRPRWLRLTSYVVLLLVLALVAGSVAGVRAVRRSFPDVSGSLTLPGLRGEVDVLRNDLGVPRIYADTAHDLFYAQGFVQAQDRFFEMDVKRHITSGRLSEMFGEDTVETDMVVRTLGWREVAERELALLSPEALDALQSFSDGVNAYIESHTTDEMALEYTLLSLTGLDYRVEEWTPADSVAWLKAMAWDLRGNMQDEVERASLATRLDLPAIAELFPDYPYDRHRPIVEGGAVRAGRFVRDALSGDSAARPPLGADALRALDGVRAAVDALPTMLGRGSEVGSNAWAVSGERSTTGQPLLANDPHLAPSVPSVWYQMGLHCRTLNDECPYDVSGYTFAGFPGVVIGHNREIAWGFTNLGPDVADLYLEAVEGERYLRGRELVPFEGRPETIKVAGGDPVTFTVRSTVHGPVLSDVADTYASVGANAPVSGRVPDRGNGYAVSLAWTALNPARTAESVFALNRAGNWSEFRAAAELFSVPSQNMVYADRAGHIGYQAPGLIPIRRPLHRGSYPAPGWDRRYDWTGRFVPFDELPSVLDPEDGFVATANQAVVSPSYPYYLGDSWAYGYRSQRIIDVIEKRGVLSPADMSALQNDTRNGFAPFLVPYLLDVEVGGGYYSAGQRLLAVWDHTQPADSPAAAYYNAVWRHLLRLTFHDQLPEDGHPEGGDRWFEVVRTLLQQPTSMWWDDVDTADVKENRDDILRQAQRDARDELTRLQSRRADRWTWGHQHTLTLENQTVGQSDVGLVRRLLNRGPWEVGGGSSIVNAIGWDAAEGYEVDWVPSMRMVVDLSDLDASTWVNLAGASGHAFHENYTDQTDLWATGRTAPWAFTPEAVDADTEERLRLVPAAGR